MDPKRTIYVENFPIDISENALNNIFKIFGTIRHVELPTFSPNHPRNKGRSKLQTKGFAFIEYTSIEFAEKACSFFNDLKILSELKYQPKTETSGTCVISDGDKILLAKLEKCSGHESAYLFRVMSKRTHQYISNQYREMRLQSLIQTAKFLIMA